MSNLVTEPQTSDQLQQQAQQQAAAEISAQVAPLQAQTDVLGGKEQSAATGIGNMFQGLLPSVADSAQRVQQSNQQAVTMEQQVYQQAGQQLNAMAQNQAAEAQQLAQQVGGPVSTGEFTSSLTPYEMAFPSQEAGGLLNALGNSQAGTQEAEQFAGQVFPALQSEQQAQSRQFYEDQIKGLNDQITSIQASKGQLTNTKFQDMLEKERTFQLNQSQLKLDQLKANRDWQATQHTLRNQDAELGIAKTKTALDVAATTGTFKGKPTVAEQRVQAQQMKVTADTRLAAQRLGLDAQKLQLATSKYYETSKIQQQRLTLQQQHNAMQILDAAMNPTSGKPVTQTVKQFIPKNSSQALALERASFTGKVPANTYKDPKTQQWFVYQKLTLSPAQWAARGGYGGGTAVTDPNRLYNMLTGTGIPKGMAQNLVRTKTGLNDWKPGADPNYKASDLAGEGVKELRGLAIERGWSPSRKGGKQAYMDFILSRNPATPLTAPAGG